MSGVNIHIYPSPITHESRILKETDTVRGFGIVDEIYIVGLWKEGLAEQETLDDTRKILRIKLMSNALGNGLLIRPIKLVEWTLRIVSKFVAKDVAFVNVHNLTALPIGCVLKLLKRTTLIYDTHELETEQATWTKHTKWIAKVLERVCIALVDKVIVVSPSIGEWYQAKYRKPTFTVLNAPRYTRVSNNNLFRKHLNIPKDHIIFLYQGSLIPGRGIEKILDAFTKVEAPNKVVVFMGYGPLEPAIKEAAQQHSNIYFYPAVSPSEVLDYTSSADVGFSLIENTCLNHFYSMPNKLFEYTMAEIPVVVPSGVEMKKLVEKHQIGYVVKTDDSRDIAKLIDEIDESGLSQFKPHLTSFKKIYNWENQEATLASIYKDQLQGPRK